MASRLQLNPTTTFQIVANTTGGALPGGERRLAFEVGRGVPAALWRAAFARLADDGDARFLGTDARGFSIVTTTPIPGEGMRRVVFDVSPECPPSLWRSVFAILAGDEDAEVDAPHVRALEAAGVLVLPSSRVATLEPFSCPLDGSISQLIPHAERHRPFDIDPHTLVVNPHIVVQEGEPLPQALSGQGAHRSHFARQYPMLWVFDPGLRVWVPYWPEGPLVGILDTLLHGALQLHRVSQDTLRILVLAHILVPAGYAPTREAEWERRIDAARNQLTQDQFAVVRGVLHPLQLAALRRFYRAMYREGFFGLKCPQVPERDFIHNEPTARFVHNQLAGVVDRITPERIKPSYAFLAEYHPGAELKRHVDREQCAWNMSVVLDADPETSIETAWPIYVEVGGAVHEIRLALGDGVIYRGTHIPHWRNRQPEGHRSTICFFHFVGADFEGALE